jgi:hypothetical protein
LFSETPHSAAIQPRRSRRWRAGIERALLDEQHGPCRIIDPLADRVAVHRRPAERFEDQQIEAAAEKIDFGVGHDWLLGCSAARRLGDSARVPL